MKLDITTVYLKFLEENDKKILVSVADILNSGNPIHPETGEDLELVDGNLYKNNGDIIVSK